jgi:hypothetical protein
MFSVSKRKKSDTCVLFGGKYEYEESRGRNGETNVHIHCEKKNKGELLKNLTQLPLGENVKVQENKGQNVITVNNIELETLINKSAAAAGQEQPQVRKMS